MPARRRIPLPVGVLDEYRVGNRPQVETAGDADIGDGGLGRRALALNTTLDLAVDVELLVLRLQPAVDLALDADQAEQADVGIEVEIDVSGGPDDQLPTAQLLVEDEHLAAELQLPRLALVSVGVQDRAVDGQRRLAGHRQSADADDAA